DLVLVCDIGGGTSDFSLIRARVVDGDVQFERTAIGEHLLLGGDNLDIALTRIVEAKIGAGKLSVRQRHALQRACCAAKERLLSDATVERVPVSVLGSGRAIVGQMISAELTREDVLKVLSEGFLPLTDVKDLPKRDSRLGLRELGLPYASDPAITKHLAAFLTRAESVQEPSSSTASTGHGGIVRPDAILFNGGFCAAEIARERIVDAISEWFRNESDWRPRVLNSGGMESAVAVGAAYYALVRHGQGVRIKAGSARTYYVATRSEHGMQGVCVLPRGTEEGTTLLLADQNFTVLANRAVSFTLYSSTVRSDPHGAVAHLDESEVHRHAPLGTLLRYGKKMREVELAVRLRVTFTEMGTLELWCESSTSEHRWRLQFELRGHEADLAGETAVAQVAPRRESAPEISEQAVATAKALIRDAFGADESAVAPEQLVARVEETLGKRRDSWPLPTLRRLCDALAAVEDGRKRSPRHEVRWLNLFGFCLRPGFGAVGDDARMRLVRKLYMGGAAFPREIPCQVELLVLLRRVAGGLNSSQQQELYKKHSGTLGISGKRRERVNKQIERETWRLIASLEHVSAVTRTQLGNALLEKLEEDAENKLWCLGRLGARIPVYGPLGCVVPREPVAQWISSILQADECTPELAFAVIQLGAYTGDRARDIDEAVRKDAIAKLFAAGIDIESVHRLEKFVPPSRAEMARILGDPIPQGLQLQTSSNCLLTVSALTVDVPA
ncbi:MAG TPA: Hsp70 family protein, partial [Candidatus Acidoferrales bacterium]|nr:Hsp70 family protein [Candidatus Acidoferrales bacterium]